MFQTLVSSNPSSLHHHFYYTPPLSSPSLSSPSSPHTQSTSTTSFPSTSRQLPSLRCQATVATDTSTYASNQHSHHHHRCCSPASLYDILRVNRTASMTEIKTAYRTLAKLYHPDAAPSTNHIDGRDGSFETRGGDGVDFIAIHNAYETLSDPSARALYDLSLGFGGRGGGDGGGIRSSSSASAAANWAADRRRSTRFYTTRRWETDQCW